MDRRILTRRGLIQRGAALAGLALLAACERLPGLAPPKVPRIGHLSSGSFLGIFSEAFGQGLREHGYVEGQNVTLEARYAEGKEERLADLAARNRLPTMYGRREWADVGGLMVHGVNFPDIYRRAATYVDKILKGAKPADLPVEQPSKFDVVINLKTAHALGLTIPPSVLQQATEIIQ